MRVEPLQRCRLHRLRVIAQHHPVAQALALRVVDRVRTGHFVHLGHMVARRGQPVDQVTTSVPSNSPEVSWSSRPTACTPPATVLGRWRSGAGSSPYTLGQAEGRCEHSVPAGLCSITYARGW